MKYLAIDPGETSGYAEFDDNGEVTKFDQISNNAHGMSDYLENLTDYPEIIICEDYKLYGHLAKQQTGSRMVTVKVIGVIEAWAHRHKIKVVLQPANIKVIAEKWSGYKAPSNHAQSHKFDALNHGIYYLVNHKIIQPIIVKETQNGRKAQGQ